MNLKFNQMLCDLNEELSILDIEIDDRITKSEKAIEIILTSVDNVKKEVLRENFKSQEHEIDFFKNIKPKFTSKLIYYNAIYKIETKMPHGGNRVIRKYLNHELERLKKYYDRNIDFYTYHRTGSSYLDFKYFIRGKHDIKLRLDSYYFESDSLFSTSHDFKVAKILAHSLIQIYLEHRLTNMDNAVMNEKSQLEHNLKLKWTGSKVGLVELIYALHCEGVFNNGACDLKDVIKYFETTFSINLGQYRRVFLEIRMRKHDKTKFISNLIKSILRRMDDLD